MTQTILITGTLGFIGSNFIKKVIDKYPQYRFIGIDKGVRPHNLENMFYHDKYKFYMADIADKHIMENIFSIEKPDIVINMCAESFVDNAISDIMPFLHSNIIGTQILVNAALKYNVSKFIHISTDETLGQKLSLNEKPWTETDVLNPRNPYACSKAGAELVIQSAHHTHKLNFNITRACNIFGPQQKKENLIPHIITSLIHDKPIKIHGNGLNFRQYCFVDDKIDAIMKIIINGKINEIYNISDNNFSTNLNMVNYIANFLNKEPNIIFIEDRKAHDFGYNLSSDKLKSIGWSPKQAFNQSMKQTINWYLERYK